MPFPISQMHDQLTRILPLFFVVARFDIWAQLSTNFYYNLQPLYKKKHIKVGSCEIFLNAMLQNINFFYNFYLCAVIDING